MCDDLYSSKNNEALDVVQSISSHWVLGSTLALALTSIITAQFLGSWSDTYGRKIPMLLPPLGEIVLQNRELWQVLYCLSAIIGLVCVSFL